MAFRAVTVAVSATPAIAVNVEYSEDGARALLLNTGAAVVYIGGDDLTAGNTATKGYPIAVAGSVSLHVAYGEQVYAVVPSGTSSLAVAMSGVK